MNKTNKTISAIETIDPRTCLNVKIRRLARMSTHIYERELKVFGLRSSQIGILFMVGKKGSSNQKEVANFLFIDQSTMSRDLTMLTKKNLIQVSKGEDARHSQLMLTNRGYKLLEDLVPAWKQVHDKIETALGSYSISAIDLITGALMENTKR